MLEQLNKAVVSFYKRVKEVPEDAVPELNIYINLLLTLNLELSALKKNPSYIFSNDEFNSTIEMLMKLQSGKASPEDLLKIILTLNDILNERDPLGHANRLTVIEKVIKNIKNACISMPKNSPTAIHIVEKCNAEIIYLIPVDKENIFIFYYEMQRDVKYLIEYYSENSSKQNEFILATQEIFKTSKNKEEFAVRFFSDYAALCKASDLKKRETLLKTVGNLINIFSEELELAQLNKALNELKFSETEKEIFAKDIVIENRRFLNSPKMDDSLEELLEKNESLINLYSNNLAADKWDDHLNVQNIGESFYAIVKYSNIKTENFESRSSLNKLPLTMQWLMLTKDKNLQDQFANFVSLFIKTNEKAEEQHKREITIFFSQHYSAISQFITIMGEEGIAYLHKQIAGTALTLERTLELIPLLSDSVCHALASYFRSTQSTTKKNSEEINNFISTVSALGALLKTNSYNLSESMLVEIIQESEKNKIPPKQILNLLAKKLLGEIFQEIIEDFTEEEINDIFARTPPAKFVQLVSASQRMAKDEYRQVFLEMLKRDLTRTNKDVQDFLHNKNQKNKLGRAIAKHNQAIRKELSDQHLNVNNVLNYNKKLDFVVYPDGADNSLEEANAIITLWTYLVKLESTLENCSKQLLEKEKNSLKIIQGHIKTLKEKIEKNKLTDLKMAEELSREHSKKLISIIVKKINILKNSNTTSEFKEFAGHVQEQFEWVNKKTESKKEPKKADVQHFSVLQWSKEQAQTFFLGDEVGCCLATTGGQFQAMVQRRMDDAMLFHVAIDQNTKRPAALIWLYLAKTVDGEIVLMANFFEVNTKYAENNNVRKALLNGFLEFTHDYCKANPGIKGFYMNKLKYGWNIRDLDNYPMVDLKIADKLGGPFVPHTSEESDNEENAVIENEETLERLEPELTKEKYYLVSLEQTQFHRFDSTVLSRDSQVVSSKTKEQLIQEGVNAAIQKLEASNMEINLENLKKAIINSHKLELAPFYQTAIENDSDFLAEVSTTYNSQQAEAKSEKPFTNSSQVLSTSLYANSMNQTQFAPARETSSGTGLSLPQQPSQQQSERNCFQSM